MTALALALLGVAAARRGPGGLPRVPHTWRIAHILRGSAAFAAGDRRYKWLLDEDGRRVVVRSAPHFDPRSGIRTNDAVFGSVVDLVSGGQTACSVYGRSTNDGSAWDPAGRLNTYVLRSCGRQPPGGAAQWAPVGWDTAPFYLSGGLWGVSGHQGTREPVFTGGHFFARLDGPPAAGTWSVSTLLRKGYVLLDCGRSQITLRPLPGPHVGAEPGSATPGEIIVGFRGLRWAATMPRGTTAWYASVNRATWRNREAFYVDSRGWICEIHWDGRSVAHSRGLAPLPVPVPRRGLYGVSMWLTGDGRPWIETEDSPDGFSLDPRSRRWRRWAGIKVAAMSFDGRLVGYLDPGTGTLYVYEVRR